MWCDGTTEAWVTPTRVTDQQRGHSGTFSVHMISLRSMVTAVIVSVALGWTGSWPLPQAQPALSGALTLFYTLLAQWLPELPQHANFKAFKGHISACC